MTRFWQITLPALALVAAFYQSRATDTGFHADIQSAGTRPSPSAVSGFSSYVSSVLRAVGLTIARAKAADTPVALNQDILSSGRLNSVSEVLKAKLAEANSDQLTFNFSGHICFTYFETVPSWFVERRFGTREGARRIAPFVGDSLDLQSPFHWTLIFVGAETAVFKTMTFDVAQARQVQVRDDCEPTHDNRVFFRKVKGECPYFVFWKEPCVLYEVSTK